MAFTLREDGGLKYMTADGIGARHAFTTRYGGISRGIYASLNLRIWSDDDRNAVRSNYNTICRALGSDTGHLVTSRQVHSDTVRIASKGDVLPDLFLRSPYETDGLITAEPGLLLAIFVADCVPVLLWDPETPAVGAVHAGWRGTMIDIAGKAAAKMCAQFGSKPENIRAAIGQCIDKCCFETGPEVPEAARALLGLEAEAFIERRGEKYHVDLKGINRNLLLRRGLLPEHIDVSDECTVCSNEKYWSHRATGGKRGACAALITL